MNHLRVSLRILLGFGVILLLLAAVGGAGVLGLGRTIGQIDAYAGGAELTVTVMQAQNDLQRPPFATRRRWTTRVAPRRGWMRS